MNPALPKQDMYIYKNLGRLGKKIVIKKGRAG
jgi:hypothetical protein